MSVNSYKEDEHSTGTSKRNTLKRLFSYLLFYKKKITFVLMIMGFCVVVSLLNPLFMEYAIDILHPVIWQVLSGSFWLLLF